MIQDLSDWVRWHVKLRQPPRLFLAGLMTSLRGEGPSPTTPLSVIPIPHSVGFTIFGRLSHATIITPNEKSAIG